MPRNKVDAHVKTLVSSLEFKVDPVLYCHYCLVFVSPLRVPGLLVDSQMDLF